MRIQKLIFKLFYHKVLKKKTSWHAEAHAFRINLQIKIRANRENDMLESYLSKKVKNLHFRKNGSPPQKKKAYLT